MLSRADTFWGNIVLLKRVKSACGVGMWFESSRSPSSFPLPSPFPVTHLNGFFSGTVTSLPLGQIFLFPYFHFCVSVRREGEGMFC